MPLTNGRFMEFRFDGEYIHFKLEDGPAVVECAVTAEFLDARAWSDGMRDQPRRAIFMLYRKEIEHLASAKYDMGSDRPLIMHHDVPT